ncbi:coiled-coil domain-containing protein 92-like [Physella acuta]|uniref:coiled-coil domain-containing protein 92-like n=1 Tax=Physella acuta TaxID=109671 RepID=UPI0027DD392E|nr:coiled-coil domain-containing protein 92-like [Physella acuta]
MNTEAMFKKQNLESSILFMQQEHSTMLKALHEEINGLQKKCSDLTFQLTMQGLTVNKPGDFEDHVQKEIDTSQEEISKLEKKLSEQISKVERLEAEARAKQKKRLDESRQQAQVVSALRAELEAKSNNIAYLTTELHKLKQKARTEHPEATALGTSHTGAQGPPTQPGHPHAEASHAIKKSHIPQHYIPVPPPKDKNVFGTGRLRRSGHAKVIQQGQLLNSSRSSGSESPDISPFLQISKDELTMGPKQAPVLPPIPVSSASLTSNHSVLVHRVVSSTSQLQAKKLGTKAEAAIVTLAVENAAGSDPAWKLAHESRSSEYN